MSIYKIDASLIGFFRKASVPLARFGLFVIFFWFGSLKILNMSPASPLVQQLAEQTVPFASFPTFFLFFGALEVAIGILFLVRGAERVVIPLLLLHMATTFLPLILLPEETWSAPLVPTLEGQYIIKNLALIAAAVGIAANLQPLLSNKEEGTA